MDAPNGCAPIPDLPPASPGESGRPGAVNGPHGVIEVEGARYTWRPPGAVAHHAPADYRLELECRVSPSGDRWFVPTTPLPAFLLHADLGGNALLARDPGFDGRHRSTCRVMRLLWQQAPRVLDHLTRRFHLESDLYAAHSAGTGGEGPDVLPDTVGLEASGGGTRWGPGDVLAAGRAAAERAGDPSGDPARWIRLGLLAAARWDPIDPRTLSPVGGSALSRFALFGPGPEPGAAGDELVERVFGRLGDKLLKHAGDDRAAFAAWLLDDVDNIVHGIAKRKRDGGPIPRPLARQAHLELVWRSFEYLGRSIDVVMRAFAAALPHPLTGREHALFEAMYLRHTHFGGLPLMLLFARFEFLKEAILAVWDCPGDRQAVGALLQMVRYYGEMAWKRREADQRISQRRHARNADGKVARVLSIDTGGDAAAPSSLGLLQEVAAVLRELRRASCVCGSYGNWRAELGAGSAPEGPIVIEDWCEACGHFEAQEYSKRELEQVGRTVFDGPE